MYRILLILAAVVFLTFGHYNIIVSSSYAAPTDSKGVNWSSVGGGYDEQHFSPLTQISTENVSKLGLAWSLDLPDEHNLEGNPLAIDGVLYFSGQMSKVYAVDAVSGKVLWIYDPETAKQLGPYQHFMFPTNRGVAYWNGKVFVATLDGRLIGLDAKTGTLAWSTKTIPSDAKSTVTGAPRAINGKVLIGNGGGDFGFRGYLTAYDSETGKQLWRFYAAPGDPAIGFENDAVATASKTWSGEYWKTGTGGGPWGAITYDAELNRVYIGTGNAGPWNPEVRSPGGGDNLFVSSIVAVDADTGKYIWHYQINPRDSWDFKACMDIALTHVLIDGRDRRVLIQSPTNGFFYVIDRDTGKLISAEKTGKVTWAKRIDLASGRPVEIPNAHYQNGPITFWPSPLGAHNWQSMSYSPQTGLAYIPYMKSAVKFEARPNGSGFGLGVHATFMKIDDDDFTGKLLAWDPIAQKARWSVPRNLMWNGGIASTAGNLVFQGDANGIFHAYNANSGRALWDFDAKLGIVGSPISYMVGGRQYISILVGFGGATGNITQFNNYGWKYGEQPRRLLTFALDGRSKLPPTAPRRFEMKPMDDQKLVIDIAAATTGAALYGSKGCSICHGDNVKSDGNPAPDLQESRVALDYQAFVAFLRSGAAAQNGMPQFDFSDDEARSIFMYIRLAARDMLTGKTTIKRERGSSL